MTTQIGSYNADHIKNVVKEVQRIQKARKDYTSDRSKLSVTVVEEDGMGEDGPTKVKGLRLVGQGIAGEPLAFRRRSLLQLAGSLDMPTRYIDRLVNAGHHDIVAHDLTALLSREPKRHLVRTLDGRLDAFLSDRYRSFSNEDLMLVAMQEINKAGAEVWDLRLTDDDFRIQAVAPHISGQIDTNRNRGSQNYADRWNGKEGDTLNAAVTITNSETGGSKLAAQFSILRRICMNFGVHADGVARVHLGRRIEGDGEVIYQDDTKKADDNVVWMQIRDVIASAFNPKVFAEKLAKINETTKRDIEKPTVAVEATIRAFNLPLERKEAILETLLGSGDKTQYGLAQAITEQVNPTKGKGLDDGTRNQLEDVGGAILEMGEKEWKKLLATPLKGELVGAN